MSQLRAEELQENDDQERPAHDARLDAVFGLRACFGRPVELDVSDDEATCLGLMGVLALRRIWRGVDFDVQDEATYRVCGKS